MDRQSAQIEEVPINHNRFRNSTKYRKENVLKHYLEFKNTCQIISVYEKDLKGLAWLRNRLHHWKNAAIGYYFTMIAPFDPLQVSIFTQIVILACLKNYSLSISEVPCQTSKPAEILGFWAYEGIDFANFLFASRL